MGEPLIERMLEALLFVADGPVSVEDLSEALETGKDTVAQAVEHLTKSLDRRGLRLVRKGSRIQMVSAPEATPFVERFLGADTSGKLSGAACETLAIIAYRQPITRAQIEAIRGVNCDGVLRTLLAKSLVAQVGRLEQAGRPLLYGTTFEFLQYFAIESLRELPTLPDPDESSPDRHRRRDAGSEGVEDS